MSSTLNVIITDAGIAEVVNAQHTGTAPVVLTQVGFGRGIYTPTADQTALHDEIKRVSTIAGGVVGSNIMHIQALDSGEASYAVYEIGVYTASGTLFAVYSQPMPILHKVANSSIMCVIDFVLSGVSPTAVTVGDTDYTLAPATTTNLGVVELATDSEVVAGTDTERAITPAGGAAAYVTLAGDQTISGGKTFTGAIQIGDGSAGSPDLTIHNYLQSYSSASFSGNVSVGGNLGVSGNATVGADLTVSGMATVQGLAGTAPEYSTSNTLLVPVGGIICAYLTSSRAAGGTVTVSANTIKACHWDADNQKFVEGMYYISAGKYRVVMGLNCTSAAGGAVLLQCLE